MSANFLFERLIGTGMTTTQTKSTLIGSSCLQIFSEAGPLHQVKLAEHKVLI